MTTVYNISGFDVGSNLGDVTLDIAGITGTVNISNFALPNRVSGIPLVSDGFNGDTFTVDVSGLTNPIAYQWILDGVDVPGATSSTFSDTSDKGMQRLSVRVTADEGDVTSPPVMIYPTMSRTDHNRDDKAVVAIVPHNEVTHIAVNDGRFDNPATWFPAEIPRDGAFALIPWPRNIIYDRVSSFRLDRIRNDGTLRADTAALTNEQLDMVVETLVTTKGSDLQIGTPGNTIPTTANFRCTFSNRVYGQSTFFPTNLKESNYLETLGWGRGAVFQGDTTIWGTDREPFARIEPVSAGSSTITVRGTMPDWQVGERIVVAGTEIGFKTNNRQLSIQDEERDITDITGNVITLSAPLTFDHDNPVPGSTRTDVYPVVILYDGRNVSFETEDGESLPPHQRAHMATVHGAALPDWWHVQAIELGRTDKTKPVGKITTDNLFLYFDPISGVMQTKTPEVTDNIQARYVYHLHHSGWILSGQQPTVQRCFFRGTPGWGFVHHATAANFRQCVGYNFVGAGMVSEAGSELLEWTDCVMVGGNETLWPIGTDLRLNLKIQEGGRGIRGDVFIHHVGFAFRGRAMRTNRNIAASCHTGHGFFHRGSNNPSETISLKENLSRSRTDLKETGRLNGPTPYTEFLVQDYPIIHHADNEAFGCTFGMFVSKDSPLQNHDANVKLKRFKVVGSRQTDAWVEYVGTYILEDFDLLSNAVEAVHIGGNTYQIFTRRLTAEGQNVGVFHDGGTDVLGAHDKMPEPNNARWGHIGYQFINVGQEFTYDVPVGAVLTGPQVTLRDPDLAGDRVDYDRVPNETWPLNWADWDGGSVLSNLQNNTTGTKQDNISLSSDWAPKPWQDRTFSPDPGRYGTFQFYEGHWSQAGQNKLFIPEIISDRITGRPEKFIKTVTYTGAGGGTYNGEINFVDTPIQQNDLQFEVAAGTTTVLNIAAGATGGDGTFRIDRGDHIAPQNGIITIDYAAATVAYTPDELVTSGTDEFYVALCSGYNEGAPVFGGQNIATQYKMVRVDILILPPVQSDVGVNTPSSPQNFDAVGGVKNIKFILASPPETSGRKILYTEYRTAPTAPWIKLCNGWKQGEHLAIVKSDGSNFTVGGYTVSIRVATDYDYAFSQASPGVGVVVS